MRRLLAVSVVVVGALIAVALWSGGERGQPSPETGETGECESSAPRDAEVLISPSLAPPAHERAPVPATVKRELEEASRAPYDPRSVAAPSLPRPGLAGRVVRSDGSPVAGAEVVLESPGPFRSKLAPLATTSTAADGTFELACIWTGPFLVAAIERDGARATGQGTLEGVMAGRTDLEIVLHSCLVRGVVVDDVGRAVTDYRIAWTPLTAESAHLSSPGERLRTSGGEFAEELTPGKWRCSVTPRGGFVSAERELDVPLAEPLTITVARKAIVRGVVVDPTGKPVARARLQAPDARIMGQPARKDGSFELAVLPAQKTSLWAVCGGYAPSEMQDLFLAPGEETAEITLHLGWLAHLTGEVVDPDGRPVAGREVRFSVPLVEGIWSSRQEMAPVLTDANGRFSAEVLPGRIEVWVEISDDELLALGRPLPGPGVARPCCTRAVALAPGETGYVHLAMGGSPVRLHGRIEIGGKVPPDVSLRAHGWSGAGSQLADYAAGDYEVVLPEAGIYTLFLHIAGTCYQPTVDAPAGTEFRFDISIPTARISGRVLDQAGRALDGVVVDAYIQGEERPFRTSGRATTDRSGAYSMDILPGAYRVHPREDFEEQRSFRESEPQLVRVEPGDERRDVDFVLQTIGALEGTVRSGDGGVLEEAWVAVSGSTPGSDRRERAVEGAFHIPLEGGEYWVSATGAAGPVRLASSEPVPVQLAQGAVQGLELRLVPHTLVRVRLLDRNDEELLASLEAIDERGRAGTPVQIEPGVHWILLLPGKYTLRVLHEHLSERMVEVPEGAAELELEWRLE